MFFGRNDAKDKENPPESPDHWSSLMRGQIIGAHIQKQMDWIMLADQKAQAMIILNSILVPIALNRVTDDALALPATIAILTAFSSIFASILCIYPKRRQGKKPRGDRNLLHFGDIGRLPEARYLEMFAPIYNDSKQFTEAAIKDMHDIARHVILPKFFWLKLSYGVFFVGNAIAVGWGMVALWS